MASSKSKTGAASSAGASPSTEAHRAQAPASIRCFVLTVSDTRTLETDKGGALIEELLKKAGHVIVAREIVTDTQADIANAVRAAIYHTQEPEAVIVTGGSG